MNSIQRCMLLTLLIVCGSASAMTITDLGIGKHAFGPNLTQKDLNGKAVLVVFWGTH